MPSGYVSPLSPLLLAALILTAWEMAGRGLRALRGNRPRISRLAVGVSALALPIAFAGQLLLLQYQSGHDGPRPDWVGYAPLLVAYPGVQLGPLHPAFSLGALILAIVQTAALAGFVAALLQHDEIASDPARRLARTLTPYVAGVLGLLALWSPAVSSSDIFGYVGLGMLGPHPFDRPEHFFSGEFARFFDARPVAPTIYGPLWTAVNAAVVAPGSSFFAKVMLLRVEGFLSFAVLSALVHRVTKSSPLTAAVLLNPFLWYQFVTNAHNDILGIVLLVGAVALTSRGRAAIAVPVVAAAGLVKFPLLLVGAVVFAREGPRRAVAYALSAIVLCLVCSAVFGGKAYVDALLVTGQLTADTSPLFKDLKLAIALCSVVLTAFVLLRGRFPGFGGFVYPAIAPIFFPWYLAWALPYALAARRGALATALALPVLGVLGDGLYGFHGFTLVIPLAALAWVVWSALPRPTLRAVR